MPELVVSPRAEARLDRARAWLRGRSRSERLWIVAPTREAAHRIVRDVVERDGSAAFGWEPVSQGALVARLAMLPLGRRGLSPASPLALEAVAARVIARFHRAEKLGRFALLAEQPGFARSLATTLGDVRLAGLASGVLEAGGHPELELLRRGYEDELRQARLADQADVLAAAREGAVATPALLLDPRVRSGLEAEVLCALMADEGLATLPAGDTRALRYLRRRFTVVSLEASEDTALARAQSRLFGDEDGPQRAGDESLTLLSARGASRECVEIVRRCLAFAAQGVPFDRMAVVTHASGTYRPYLVEAFRRARVPVRFSHGNRAPDPAGRALLALLACRAEGLSARAFSEYLSLGVVPVLEDGAPPLPSSRWVAPDEALLPIGAEDTAPPTLEEPLDATSPVLAGTLRVPRDWESLIVDAAVIGGRDRWARRLALLDRRIAREVASLDPDDPRVASLGRRRRELQALRDFALPLLDVLAALPEVAMWGQWLPLLLDLATRALREPDRVLQVLGELGALAPVGPVDMGEVMRVLQPRLTQLLQRPEARDEGVYVAGTDEIRAMVFDVVFVPGVSERVFPARLFEDPLLLDAARATLGDELRTRADRYDDERLALRLALGAARRGAVVSWPEVDLERARPQVPSFYVMEVARAARGRLPSFAELKAEAVAASAVHMDWPAPSDPEEAIDATEYDLAALRKAAREHAAGAMVYLREVNPHVCRALGFRARRWSRKWTRADGLVLTGLDADKLAQLEVFRPTTKPYSATALQTFAMCPYRFALYSLFRLEVREVPEPIEMLDPLQRGSLIHTIQFELLTRARERGLLPLAHPQALAAVRELLEEVIDEVAAEYAEELLPAIPRVWEDGLADIRSDLHEWLGILHEEGEWEPIAFELSFGLTRDTRRDVASTPDPVLLDAGVLLRGAIDLVEQDGEGRLRATDHKTGKVPRWVSSGGLRIGGGRALQPLLYALALEKLHPEATVVGGRLFYCTARGDFTRHDVRLDDGGHRAVAEYVRLVTKHLSGGFLPAAPVEGGCRGCDYRPVCGPYEERRVARKSGTSLDDLNRAREQR